MSYNADGSVRGMTDEEMDRVTGDPELMELIARMVQRVRFVSAARN
jgi:hypothetical protein